MDDFYNKGRSIRVRLIFLHSNFFFYTYRIRAHENHDFFWRKKMKRQVSSRETDIQIAENKRANKISKTRKDGKRVAIMQEKQSIQDILSYLKENVEKENMDTYIERFEELTEPLQMIFTMQLKDTDIYEEIIGDKEEEETLYQKIHMIASYFQEMKQDLNLFCEEPKVESYDGQEVVWPTTLSLWLDDIDKMVDEIRVYLTSINRISDIA